MKHLIVISACFLIATLTSCNSTTKAGAQSSAAPAHHAAAILGATPQVLADRAAINQAILGERVLLKFGATWCPPCQKIAPILVELATERSDIAVVDIDTDEFPEVAQAYQVEGIPTLILLKKGSIVSQKVGFVGKDELNAWIDSDLK